MSPPARRLSPSCNVARTEVDAARILLLQKARSRGVHPFGRYLYSTLDAPRSQLVIHRTSKLIGDEIADHGRAISSVVGHGHRWAAHLPPLEHQLAPPLAVAMPLPAYQNLAATV